MTTDMLMTHEIHDNWFQSHVFYADFWPTSSARASSSTRLKSGSAECSTSGSTWGEMHFSELLIDMRHQKSRCHHLTVPYRQRFHLSLKRTIFCHNKAHAHIGGTKSMSRYDDTKCIRCVILSQLNAHDWGLISAIESGTMRNCSQTTGLHENWQFVSDKRIPPCHGRSQHPPQQIRLI